MAEIIPIRPFRYNEILGRDIDTLISPLFDVVSERQRNKLYANHLNSIYLSVPKEGPGQAEQLLGKWKADGILKQDPLQGIYVYYQYFKLSGNTTVYCRKGFVCHIRAYDWTEKVILRHESTIPDAVSDRILLLEKTGLHASPTHGLYTDPYFELEAFMDLAIENPIYETEDYQGVREVMAVIQDASVIAKFIDKIASQQIILADGHHRYQSSLEYLKKSRAANKDHTGKEGYNYHLMYLTNTESNDLRILPTHRVIQGLSITESEVMEKIHLYFNVIPVEDADTLNEIIAGKDWNFGLIFKDNAYRISLKPGMLSLMTWPFPEQIKKLDLTIMHYYIIEKVLGIPGKVQPNNHSITYDRSFSDCLKKVIQGDANFAIITNEVTIDDVKVVCASGYTMPQKSTYFYPKVIAGLLFSSISEKEFLNPSYAPF
ncbi:MAG: DUF1015 domain-containing protein [Chryseolinea sp.]